MLPVLLVLATGLSACENRNETISRETFVETMTDLRTEAAQTPLERLSGEEAERVLEQHDVTEEDLRAFVEEHGRDVPFMTEVWTEVEERVRAELEDVEEAPDEIP